MKKHGGNVMAGLLADYGVTAVFGVPGGQTLPLYYGILDEAPRIRHILMKDEIDATFAADAYARVSGGIGVCDATAGCGAIKFISGLAEAYNTSIPVIAIGSEMEGDWLAARYRGTGSQVVDSKEVLKPVTKWQACLPHVNKMPELVQTAAQMATSGRPGPVFIECPWRPFREEYTGPDYTANRKLASLPAHRPTPSRDEVDEAIRLLESAQHPVMLVGGGAWRSGAREEITALAQRMAIPVAASLTGKGVLPENHPLSLGVVGSLGGNDVSKAMVEGADVILAIGFKFSQNSTYGWAIPKAGQKEIRIDIDEAELNKMHTTDIGLVGDAKATLQLLLDRLGSSRDAAPVEREIAQRRQAWREKNRPVVETEDCITPQKIVSLLNELCGDDTILACDASFSCGWAGSFFDVYGNRRAILPRGAGGLGYGLPAGIGAAAARPDSSVVVLTGDGGLNYCLGEMAVLQEQHMNVKVVVINNSILGWIKWYEAAMWDGRFTDVDTETIDYAAVARGLNCAGVSIRNPKTLREELKAALELEGPAVIDITTVETEACKFTDDPKAVAYVRESARQKQQKGT